MKKRFLPAIITVLTLSSLAFAESTYIHKRADNFTELVSAKNHAYHADAMLTVNKFNKTDGNGTSSSPGVCCLTVQYRYLGVDNDHNLHIMRKEITPQEIKEGTRGSISHLIFQLNSDNSGEITLTAGSDEKEPLLIRLKVTASNNGIRTRYLGDLPAYIENVDGTAEE